MFTIEKILHIEKNIQDNICKIKESLYKPTKIIMSEQLSMEMSSCYGYTGFKMNRLFGLPVEIGYFDNCNKEFIIVIERETFEIEIEKK